MDSKIMRPEFDNGFDEMVLVRETKCYFGVMLEPMGEENGKGRS